MIALFPVAGKGLGILATEFIPSGTTIEIAPITLVKDQPPSECFPFDEESDCDTDGMIGWCNHSYDPNAFWVLLDHTSEIRLIAARDIAPSDEVTIPYNFKLWFEPT